MDSPDLLRLVVALVFTLALIGLCAFIAQRFGQKIPGLGRGSASGRLQVVEWKPLDGRHQLFLLRRDDVEHLVILSPHGSPVVVEQGIERPAPVAPQATAPAFASPFSLGPASPPPTGSPVLRS